MSGTLRITCPRTRYPCDDTGCRTETEYPPSCADSVAEIDSDGCCLRG